MSQTRALFDRWCRLEAAKKEISDDLKELFSEAKGNGYDSKALRAAFRIAAKAENETDSDREFEALVDTYLADLTRVTREEAA